MLVCTEVPPADDITTVIKKRKISWMKNRKLKAELASDEIKIDVLKEVIEEVDAVEHKETNCQEFLDRILQYTPLRVVLLILAVIDVAVVVSEILVTLHVYDIERSDAEEALTSLTDFLTDLLKINKTNDVTTLKLKLNETFHSLPHSNGSLRSHHADTMLHRSTRSSNESPTTTTQHHNPIIDKLHLVEKVLDIITITILGFFVLMALLQIIAEGKKFFTKKTEIIDSAVSFISFILYATKISGVLRKDAAEAVIVLLLLWQIVHMFNGIVMSEMKRLDFRITLLKRTRNKLETKLVKKKKKLTALKEEIKLNKALCKRKGLEWESPDKSKKTTPSLANGIARIASLTLGVTLTTTSLNLEMEKQERKRKANHFIYGDVSYKTPIGQFPDKNRNGVGQNGIDLAWMTFEKKDHYNVGGNNLEKINEAYENDDDDSINKIGYNQYMDIIDKEDDKESNSGIVNSDKKLKNVIKEQKSGEDSIKDSSDSSDGNGGDDDDDFDRVIVNDGDVNQ